MNILAELGANYRIEPTPATATKEPRSDQEVDITAYRNPQSGFLMPDKIRLIVNERTGVTRVILLKLANYPGQMGTRQPRPSLRLDLLRETIVSDEFYEHETHHEDDRRIERR